MKLTKPQSKALFELYQRDLDTVISNCRYEQEKKTALPIANKTPTWENFLDCRRQVQVSYDCAMIFWRKMWIGIEIDGYRHS